MSFPACVTYFGLMQVDVAPRTGQCVAAYGADQSWGGLEFSHFRIRAGVTALELQSAASKMAQSVYEGQPGFGEHAILHNSQGEYVDLAIADSVAHAEALCQRWHSGIEPGGYANACQRYLSLMEPESVQMILESRARSLALLRLRATEGTGFSRFCGLDQRVHLAGIGIHAYPHLIRCC